MLFGESGAPRGAALTLGGSDEGRKTDDGARQGGRNRLRSRRSERDRVCVALGLRFERYRGHVVQVPTTACAAQARSTMGPIRSVVTRTYRAGANGKNNLPALIDPPNPSLPGFTAPVLQSPVRRSVRALAAICSSPRACCRCRRWSVRSSSRAAVLAQTTARWLRSRRDAKSGSRQAHLRSALAEPEPEADGPE